MSTQTTPSTPDPATPPSAWRWIGRWVRDPTIGRDCLLALAMLLVTLIALALACVILLVPHAVKILSGLVAGGLGLYGYRLLRRNQSRRKKS